VREDVINAHVQRCQVALDRLTPTMIYDTYNIGQISIENRLLLSNAYLQCTVYEMTLSVGRLTIRLKLNHAIPVSYQTYGNLLFINDCDLHAFDKI